MEKSKIEWTDYTWNPVTGCRHNCKYCYAAKMARRFCGDIRYNKLVADYEEHDGLYIVRDMVKVRNGRTLSFPFGFAPTLHENRLGKNCKPLMITQPINIFVCSVADLWGEWVPEEWIDRVLDVCINRAAHHNYLFLTKNPARYINILPKRYNTASVDNLWFGTSITSDTAVAKCICRLPGDINTFLSIEPIHEPIVLSEDILQRVKWVIIGAETGQQREKVVPEKAWIQSLVKQCRGASIPVFLKNNLIPVWGKNLIQDMPEQLIKKKVVLEEQH